MFSVNLRSSELENNRKKKRSSMYVHSPVKRDTVIVTHTSVDVEKYFLLKRSLIACGLCRLLLVRFLWGSSMAQGVIR